MPIGDDQGVVVSLKRHRSLHRLDADSIAQIEWLTLRYSLAEVEVPMEVESSRVVRKVFGNVNV
jgi:hypothetical protein